MNTTKQKGNIYNLAKLAKERLKQNTYTKTKGNSISTATTFANYISNKKAIAINVTPQKQIPTSYDEELYKKVCYIIETNNTQNPVSYLIDKQLFATLDPEAKQFYINNLTQKYKFMKTKYYKEHPLISYV